MQEKMIRLLRTNLFENRQFYFVCIIILFAHNLLRYFIVKYSLSIGVDEWLWSKVSVGAIITALYFFTALSALVLRNKISPLFMLTWFVLVFIAFYNEVYHFMFSENLNFYEIIAGQLQTYVSFTFPILFIGVWNEMSSKTDLNSKLLVLVELFVIINSIIIISCFFFDVEVFKSYPGSRRWGYSGLMARTTAITLSSIVFLREWNNDRRWVRLLLYSIIFFASGTKSGLLTFLLILFFVVVKSIKLRLVLLALGCFVIACTPYLIKNYIYLSPFWENIYEENGFWGVISSLRTNNMFAFFSYLNESLNLKALLIGGSVRFEKLWVEILPIDLFAWFGIIGLFITLRFYYKWLKKVVYLVPVISSFFYGGLVLEPVLVILLGVWANEKN